MIYKIWGKRVHMENTSDSLPHILPHLLCIRRDKIKHDKK